VSQVNLLPPDILEAQRWRRRMVLAGIVGAVVIALLIGYWLLQATTLSSVRGDIDDRNRTNASLQQSIADKQKFATLQTQAQAQQNLLSAAFADEVSFSSLLMDFSRVIPSDAFVDNLTVQVQDVTAPVEGQDTTTQPATGLIGSITGSGQAASIDSVASFISRLEQVKGWVNPFVSTVSRVEEINGVAYSLSVDLTDEVVTDRGKGQVDAAG
jgi:Tfp pilus assembly protein PilN